MSPAETLTALVQSTPADNLSALAGELAQAFVAVVSRASATAAAATTSPAAQPSELLTVHEAAARLGVEVSWLYRHAHELPFTKKLGGRTLRFESRGLERWAANRPRR